MTWINILGILFKYVLIYAIILKSCVHFVHNWLLLNCTHNHMVQKLEGTKFVVASMTHIVVNDN